MTDALDEWPNQPPHEEPEPQDEGEPTPEERVAETVPDDPEVGADGTGMGELP